MRPAYPKSTPSFPNLPERPRCAATAATWILIAAALCLGQSGQSFMIQKFLRENPQATQNPGAADTLQRILKKRQSTSVQEGSLGLSDSSELTKAYGQQPTAEKAGGDKSVYQKLYQGERIEPDSLIRGLEVFGQNVFTRGSAAQLLAKNELSAPATYPIGPGDEIIITTWGRLNEENRLVVDRNGSINLPRIGPVSVGGMPFSVMQETIVGRLQAMEGVKASVTMGQLRTIEIYVIGEVRSPGLYTISALADVTHALFAAGGPTPMGSLRTMELRRGKQLVDKVDFYDFLLSGRNNTDLRLQPGDVVFVPIVQNMAAVAGNVRRSAIYEIRPKSSLRDVLELAGGVSPGGWVNRLQVERMVANQYQTALDVKAETVDKIPAFPIQDGDIVKVFPVVNMNEKVVFLDGNVKRPGKYALSEGMKVSDLLGGHDGLLPETYFTYAVIERFDPPSFLARIMPFNLKNVLEDCNCADNLALQSRDRVIVYNRDYFEPDRSVSIDGAVTTPGKYKLLENMRVRDLVLQAGGLREDASPFRGEVYRREYSGEAVSTKKLDFQVLAAMEDDSRHNMALQRFDRVYVRSKKGWEQIRSVSLFGGFVYPGRYDIFEGETMADLIARAGGFTKDAYLEAAILTRPSVKMLEQQRMEEYIRQLEKEMAQTSAMLAARSQTTDVQQILDQQTKMLEKLRAAQPVGRVVIDMTKESSYTGFLLEDGDELYVPGNINTVSVIGEVYNPATFRYLSDKPQAKHYIDLSGGAKGSADTKNIYVVKANGSVVSNAMERVTRHELKPGDAVVVPQKLEVGSGYRRFTETLAVISGMLSVASLSTTTAVGVKALSQ